MKMNSYLALQKPTVADDWTPDTGQWETLYETFAAVQPISGREYSHTLQVHGDVTHKLLFHYIDGITPDMRAVDSQGRIFNFTAVIDRDERTRKLEVMATERP